jgi:elongator complex protein 3
VETILLEILAELKDGAHVDSERLAQIIRGHNKRLSDVSQHYSKKKLLPYYLTTKKTEPLRWARWNIDRATEQRLLAVLRVKPRRTASGVATITVITKPWKCTSNCVYCPSDVRMPKSYLSDEPACQRAERNYFDPYLQVASRMRTLAEMGHATDKIELIVLGGTWSDYPAAYQIWFIKELFRALNECGKGQEYRHEEEHGDAHAHGEASHSCARQRAHYETCGLNSRPEALKTAVAGLQDEVHRGKLTYNQAIAQLYEHNEAWQNIAAGQVASFEELYSEHTCNETAAHRVVGLVIETRPDAITAESLRLLRQLGCTKVQVGIQSLSPEILRQNNRNLSLAKIHESFELLRLFGFKIHAHIMVNLWGSSPAQDICEYKDFVTQAPYMPDEIKLYPCALIQGADLCKQYAEGSWQPYSEQELLRVLETDVCATPPFIRISRMIRDFSAHDIKAGNKKANLRQLVEQRLKQRNAHVQEIRYREISTQEIALENLALEELHYATTVTDEYFLQWRTPTNNIAAFARLSLPHASYVEQAAAVLPVNPYEAMLREVHVYGKVAKLHEAGEGAQHLGLGRQLIEKACDRARAEGYTKLNVISSVGTREYYRSLGFKDTGLYQQLSLL